MAINNQPMTTSRHVNLPQQKKPVRVLSMTAGKGGVGKTTLAINLAIALTKLQRQVLLFDADLSLANVDVLLGLQPKRNISHVLQQECSLNDICIHGPANVKIIPGASGMQSLASLTTAESVGLIRAFSEFKQPIDMLMVDTASGISNQVLQFAQASQDVIVVICDDPASLTDSYALIKLLNQNYQRQRFWILANKLTNERIGNKLFLKLQQIANKFLDVNLHYLGSVPYDSDVPLAAKHRRAIVDEFPGARAALAIKIIAEKLMRMYVTSEAPGSMANFFEQLIIKKSCIYETIK